MTDRLARRLIKAARHVHVTLLQRLTLLQHQVQARTERLERLGRGDPPSVMLAVSAATVLAIAVGGWAYFQKMEDTVADIV